MKQEQQPTLPFFLSNKCEEYIQPVPVEYITREEAVKRWPKEELSGQLFAPSKMAEHFEDQKSINAAKCKFVVGLTDFSSHTDSKCPYRTNTQCYKLMVKLAEGESFTNGQAQGTLHASSGDRRIRQVRAKLKDLGIEMSEVWVNSDNARYKRFYLEPIPRVRLFNMIIGWANKKGIR